MLKRTCILTLAVFMLLTACTAAAPENRETAVKEKDILNIGVDTLPPLPKHFGDRNRTSPLAFTGNKFEFRAVGSSQSIAGPLMILNTIVAESLDYIATYLENSDEEFDTAVHNILRDIITKHDRIIFNGDGYSEAWHKEAEEDRGLPNLRNPYEALPAIVSEDAVTLFKKYNVMSEREVHSRFDVYLEQYIMAIHVEAKLTRKIGKTMIYPAAARYQGELASSAASLKAIGYEPNTETLD